jgi:protein-tyrosine phosphatase
MIQVSAGSILGRFGSTARRSAHQILRRGWCHVIASDAHSPDGRPPILSTARDAAARLVGPEAAHLSVADIPAAIVAGRRVNPMLPLPSAPRPSLLRRLFGG